jgi:dTMP kinase
MSLFITFEGIDGCGKSTQINLLHTKLTASGHQTILTREPGGTIISDQIRSIILNPENKGMTQKCELLLYLAARAQHVEEKIIPELENGKIVLCDRFEESTFVYQGYGRQLFMSRIEDINTYATKSLVPNHTFVIDIDPDESEKRLIARNPKKDRMEENDRSFFERIRNGFKERVHLYPERMTLLDGSLPISTISDTILNMVLKLIEDKS